jgi:class 3 adenylate cyclase
VAVIARQDLPRNAPADAGDPAHAVRFFGLRFARRETEREYRQWRVATAMPFARVGYIGSAPSWTLLLLAIVVVDPDSTGVAVAWVGGWILLLLVLTALTFPAALRRTVMPFAAAANCLAGFLIVWLLSEVTLLDQLSQARAGVMTAGLLIVMFFGFAIFRIPPGAAVLAVTPYVAFGTVRLLELHHDGGLNDVEAASLAAAQWIAYLGGLMVCIVIELVTRRAFRQDQLIAEQQRELRSSREAVRRYVPRAVYEHIVDGDIVGIDAPTRRRVTVLFSDLVGSTTLADRVEPEILTQVVNDYMDAMSRIVDEHGGIVSEFAGDGLMALFGAPDEMVDDLHAISAVRTAQAMQDRLPALVRRWQRIGVTDPMRMRIGIDTGVLSVGSFGSEGRMTYTAIGTHANIAARLQAACEPGEIALSDATWHLVRDHIECEPRGEVECRGVHYPVRTYSPLAGEGGAALGEERLPSLDH